MPASIVLGTLTTLLIIADHSTGATHHAVMTLARYRADALLRYPWQLPLSAVLAQSWLQWIWTVVVGSSLFIALELRIGSLRASIVLALSHVIPTVVVACWAHAAGAVSVLHREDYGTSCLIMGAAGALLLVWRSRMLLAALVVTLAVDSVVNSSTTIVEHVIAVAVGAFATAGLASIVPRRSRSASDDAFEPQGFETSAAESGPTARDNRCHRDRLPPQGRTPGCSRSFDRTRPSRDGRSDNYEIFRVCDPGTFAPGRREY